MTCMYQYFIPQPVKVEDPVGFPSPLPPVSLSPPISFHGLSQEHHNYVAGQQKDSLVHRDWAILNSFLKPSESTP